MQIAPQNMSFKLQGILQSKKIIVNSNKFALIFDINQNCLSNESSWIVPLQIQNYQNEMKVYQFVHSTNANGIKTNQKSKDYNMFPFCVNVLNTRQNCQIQIKNSGINLQFIRIEHARFVKNQKLEYALSCNDGEWGLLSMDKNERILIQQQRCLYPIVGCWLKTIFTVTHFTIYKTILIFLTQEYKKKCTLTHNNKSHFYFVLLSPNHIVPQLYLFSWSCQEPKLIIQNYKLHTPQSQDSAINEYGSPIAIHQISFSNQKSLNNLLYFNLYSPIEPFNMQAQGQNSPKFEAINRISNLQEQCLELKNKLKARDLQIEKLKEQLLRTKQQLLFRSKNKQMSVGIFCQSQDNSEQKQNENRKNILTSSDLKHEGSAETVSSPSQKQKLSAGHKNGFQSTKIPDSDQRDPWEYLEIIQ